MNPEQYLGSQNFFEAYMAGDNQSHGPADKNPDEFNGENPATVAITGDTPTIRRKARKEAADRAESALATGAA